MKAIVKKYKGAFLAGLVVVLAMVLVIMLGLLSSCSSGSAAEIGARDAVVEIGESALDGIDAPDASEEPSEAAPEDEAVDGVEALATTDGNQHSPDVASGSAVATQERASGNTGTSSKQEGAASSASSTPQKKWVEETKQVWVEDRAAWTEQVPIYSTREVSICNVCGADITGNTSAHSKTHMLAGEGSGHHSEVRQTVTGYNTVNHPAEGHYETRVTGGHWE